MSLLEVRGLAKRFGGLYALRDLDLDVNEGEIVSVIGPNGAGKTTFFNAITGIYEPDGGDAIFDGHHLRGFKPNRITKLGIASACPCIRKAHVLQESCFSATGNPKNCDARLIPQNLSKQNSSQITWRGIGELFNWPEEFICDLSFCISWSWP